MGRLLGNQRDRLDSGRSRADDRDALAGELDLLTRPTTGEIDLALEVFDAIDLRRLGRGETAGGHDVIAAGYSRAVVGREQPAFHGLIPRRRRDPCAKADVTPQIIAIGNEAKVAQDFGLGCVFLRPFPRALQLRIEGVAVVDGLNVAARAGISVPVPGAADVVGLLQRHNCEAGLAQAMQKVQAGKAGTHHRDINLKRVSVARRVRSTCVDHCVWHATPPMVLYFAAGYRRVPGLSSGQFLSSAPMEPKRFHGLIAFGRTGKGRGKRRSHSPPARMLFVVARKASDPSKLKRP